MSKIEETIKNQLAEIKASNLSEYLEDDQDEETISEYEDYHS